LARAKGTAERERKGRIRAAESLIVVEGGGEEESMGMRVGIRKKKRMEVGRPCRGLSAAVVSVILLAAYIHTPTSSNLATRGHMTV
jgi:hypothetical protein